MRLIKDIRMPNKFKVFVIIGMLIISPMIGAKRISTPMQTWSLQSACEPKALRYAKGFCEGAIEAYYSLMPNWCVPHNTTHGEVQRHVIARIQELPDGSRRVPAEKFVWEQISKKWPCN